MDSQYAGFPVCELERGSSRIRQHINCSETKSQMRSFKPIWRTHHLKSLQVGLVKFHLLRTDGGKLCFEFLLNFELFYQPCEPCGKRQLERQIEMQPERATRRQR